MLDDVWFISTAMNHARDLLRSTNALEAWCDYKVGDVRGAAAKQRFIMARAHDHIAAR
jgi:hypothetical protein